MHKIQYPALALALILQPTSALVVCRHSLTMVEGHSVHRLASRFRSKLVGRTFAASSPNGRFADGAAAIDGRVLSRMEAVGKNLFAFFRDDAAESVEEVVVHVHFGMSGAWAVFDAPDEEPATKPTTRLRLAEVAAHGPRPTAGGGIVAHLSAMTVAHGAPSLFAAKKAALGQDPLRSDVDPDLLYGKIAKSKKSIGQLLMDQAYFAGPGNIYRAEILFLAGVYPTTPGIALDRAAFDRVWQASVALLRRGYDTGSILTVDPRRDPGAAARGERRYIYNKSACARCGGRVSSWDMSGRTCYACEGGVCQPKPKVDSRAGNGAVKEDMAEKMGDRIVAAKGKKKKKKAKNEEKSQPKSQPPQQHKPFISHCARSTLRQRLTQGGAEQLTVAEIRAVMEQLSPPGETALPPKSARKAVQVAALDGLLRGRRAGAPEGPARPPPTAGPPAPLPPPAVSAEDAAREKAGSGENRAVEHVAELSREQALRALAVTPSPPAGTGARGGRGEARGAAEGTAGAVRGDRGGAAAERDATPVVPASSGPTLSSKQAARLANVAVGTKLAIYWPDDKVFYPGKIHAHHPNRQAVAAGIHPGHKYTIHYDDGEVEKLDLSAERFKIVGRKARGDTAGAGKRGNIMEVKEGRGGSRKNSRRRLLYDLNI